MTPVDNCLRESGLFAYPVESRFIGQLTRETFALVLVGRRDSRLRQLTDFRAKPAVRFGGKFRIIDFTLSNCVNAGVRRSALRHSIKRKASFAICSADGASSTGGSVSSSKSCPRSSSSMMNAFGVMSVDETGRIHAFAEKPATPESIPGNPGMATATMGIYVFNAEFLYDQRWPIWTDQPQLPRAKLVFDDDGRRGIAVDAMVTPEMLGQLVHRPR